MSCKPRDQRLTFLKEPCVNTWSETNVKISSYIDSIILIFQTRLAKRFFMASSPNLIERLSLFASYKTSNQPMKAIVYGWPQISEKHIFYMFEHFKSNNILIFLYPYGFRLITKRITYGLRFSSITPAVVQLSPLLYLFVFSHYYPPNPALLRTTSHLFFIYSYLARLIE